MAIRAVIYVRVATTEQADVRLLAQLTACCQYAKERDWVLEGEFSEIGSGANLDRSQLNQMRGRIARGGIDAIIIYDLNRLSRNFVQLLRLQSEFGKHGAKLYDVARQVNANECPSAII